MYLLMTNKDDFVLFCFYLFNCRIDILFVAKIASVKKCKKV